MRFVRTLAASGLVLGLVGGASLVTSGNGDTTLSAAETNIPDDRGVDRYRPVPTVVTAPGITTTTSTTVTSLPTADTDADTVASRSPSPDAPAIGPDVSIHGAGEVPSIPAADPGDPIGDVAMSGYAPDGIGFTMFPGSSDAPHPTPYDGPSGYGIAPGCHTSCITSGLAYPRGFGAEFVIETSVPATVFVSVIADTTGDGEYDVGEFTTSSSAGTEFRWVLDHLTPAQEYFVTVAATDAHDRTDHAYGSFTTLSTRRAFVTVDGVDLANTPANREVTELWARVDGGLDLVYANGFLPMSPAEHADRFVELVFTARQRWDGGCVTDTSPIAALPLAGAHEPSCTVWTSGWTDSLDLDTPPNFVTRWTTSEVPVRVESPVGLGGSLRLRADLVVHVAYS